MTTTSSNRIEISCAAGCGATDRVPAQEDRTEKDPAKRLKPVATYAWVCLGCWRKGWRWDGDRVYQIPEHPQ